MPSLNHGSYCFRLCGQVCHLIGTLRPYGHSLPKYSQLYIYDTNSAINFRMQHPENDNCLPQLMLLLQTVISQESLYAAAFKNMAEIEDEEVYCTALEGCQPSVVKVALLEGGDQRRYNQ